MCLCVSPTVYHGGGQAAPLHLWPRFLEGVLPLTSRLCPRAEMGSRTNTCLVCEGIGISVSTEGDGTVYSFPSPAWTHELDPEDTLLSCECGCLTQPSRLDDNKVSIR